MDNSPSVWVGMHISMLLLRMPKDTWVKDPTILRDADQEGKLIITYHYEEYDVVLGWAENVKDGKIRMQGYFIQELWEIEIC